MPFKNGLPILILRSLKYCYALETKQILCLGIMPMQNIGDVCRSLESPQAILILSTWIFGIAETEACNLLGEEEPSAETRKSTLEWCIRNNIECIEACASNADFDKCLSIDGDIQGVERLLGALSAHMWPGMILKSGNRIANPSIVKKEQSSDDEFDYEVEYEVLSHGSDEPWYGTGESSMISMDEGSLKEVNQDQGHEISNSNVASGATSSLSNVISSESGAVKKVDAGSMATEDKYQEHDGSAHADWTPTPETEAQEDIGINVTNTNELDEDVHYGLDDLERLMSEIGTMRTNLRLMPDFQRREMASNLAMKMGPLCLVIRLMKMAYK